MTRTLKSIARFTGLALGGLLVGLPATAALAAEPTTAPEAQQKAQHYRERADFYESLGGTGYKTGQVQSAEAEAARYDALAAKLAAESAGTPEAAPTTPAPKPDCSSKPVLWTPDCNE